MDKYEYKEQLQDKTEKKIPCLECDKELTKTNGWWVKHIKKEHGYNSSKEYYDKHLKDNTEGICVVCGKDTTFDPKTISYKLTCSKACNVRSDSMKQKSKNTMMERYGVEAAIQNPNIQKKKEKTMLEKYGYTNNFRDEEIQETLIQQKMDNKPYHKLSKDAQNNRIKMMEERSMDKTEMFSILINQEDDDWEEI